MMYSVAQEAYILLSTIYGGILIGFIYDLYRILRGVFHPKKIATMIQDVIFWMIITGIAFYVIIFSSQGALRFYHFLGFICGALFYHMLLSRFVIRGLVFLLKNLKEFFSDFFQLLYYPFRLGAYLLESPYSYCKKKTKPLYYKIRRAYALPGTMLKDMKRSLYTYFKKK